ncbi:luciferase family protein [Streptomyces sp. NPDC102360]|uniref:luciferase domain-containing protein n=1 Tax=Streptomyces sp. NPDC102360 TaxID=3366160 RepID=UPI0037F7A053
MTSSPQRRPSPAALTATLCALAAASTWVRRDYRAWKTLGVGGLPHSPRGWLTTTCLRLKTIDPLDVTGYGDDGDGRRTTGRLAELTYRNGPRPSVGHWPIPHRPVDQSVGTAMRHALEAVFGDAVAAHANIATWQRSRLEGHCQAITLVDHETAPTDIRATRGEIAHIHPGDGSMHLVLAAPDARAVIEKSWGERHPLAGATPQLPATYLLLYPPRDTAELEAVAGILDAAVRHAAGLNR